MTSSDPDNDRYDINMNTGKGNAIGPNAQVHNIYELERIQSDQEEAYYKEMSRLLFGKILRQRSIENITDAQLLTERTLSRVDKTRKQYILQYLHAHNLIKKDVGIIRLAGTDFSGINLHKADLAEDRLGGVNFSGVKFSDADLSGADLSNANLSGADLSAVSLSGADLRFANLSGASLYLTILSNANLRYANFSKASILSSDFSNANLSGADFTNVLFNIDDVSLDEDIGDVSALLTNFSGADLSNANLSGANLGDVHLNSANFQSANLSGANLQSAIFDGLNLTDVDFSGADLSGTTMPDGSIHP